MLTIDTLNITFPTDFISDINLKKFSSSIVTKPNGYTTEKLLLENKTIGMHHLIIDETNQSIKLKVSSKLLGSNYHKGISINTLEQLIEEINNSGLKLDTNFINHSKVNSMDVKSDLRLNSKPSKYIHSLNSLISPKFTKAKYPEGISFNENIKQTKIRLLAYDKNLEFSNNRILYKKYPVLKNEFENILRIESRLSSRATIRKYFKTNDLIEILKKEKLNYIILNKIINQQKIKEVFVNTYCMSNSEEKNFGQVYYLNKLYNGDFQNIMNHVKNKLSKKTNSSYQRKQVVKYLSMIVYSENNTLTNDLSEILNALKEK